jgi:hypothetical protein
MPVVLEPHLELRVVVAAVVAAAVMAALEVLVEAVRLMEGEFMIIALLLCYRVLAVLAGLILVQVQQVEQGAVLFV